MSLKSTFKGILGEAVVNFGTWLMLDNEVYHRINNVTLPLPDGGSTQIDHVIVSKFGVFVIETKNYKGWIFGSENQAQWTQVLHKRKFKFQNPVRQNYLHIRTLSDLLELEEEKFHSVIAFIGDCQLKTKDKLPKNVLANGWIPYIKDMQTELLTLAEVSSIVEQIETQRFAKSFKTNAKHKDYVKQKVQAKEVMKPTNTVGKPPAQESKQVIGLPSNSQQAQSDSMSGKTNIDPQTVSSQPLPSIADSTGNQPNAENSIAKLNVDTTQQKSVSLESASSLNPKCPKCKSEMIKREAKKGARQGQIFWGCAKFPKCRGVVNIS